MNCLLRQSVSHICANGSFKIVLLERLKISYFNQLNCKSTMGNYVMLYTEKKKQKIVSLKFLFCCRCVETVNNKCIRRNAIM